MHSAGVVEKKGKIMKISGLAHIGVFVSDLERSIAFYRDILGFEVRHQNEIDGIKVAFISLGDLTLELILSPEEVSKRSDGIVAHIAMEVSGIEAVAAALKEKGIVFEGDIFFAEHFWTKGSKWITFRGPDNEHLELTEVL